MPKESRAFFLIVALSVLGIVLGIPRPVSAQCGSSVSSCKNCHEVQAKDPVNGKGAWHQQHAFGDFCEFCHAGNVKATDQAAAHVGMVDPMSDVKASCQSCHVNDYMGRAKKYADALGKPVGTGSAPAGATPAPAAATTGGSAPCGPSAPTGGQLIDLNKIYSVGPNPTPPPNWGNLVLIGLIGATLLMLLGLAWYYEKPLPRIVAAARNILATPIISAATPEGLTLNVPSSIPNRPERSLLERALAASDPATVRAVTQLLADRENGPKILKAVSQIDLKTLAALGESDQKALAALLALAREIKN